MKKIVLLFILLLNTLTVLSQQNSVTHTAFGKNPTVANDSLYENLQNATTFYQKFKALEELSYVHSQFGNLDSIIFYGQKMYNNTKIASVNGKPKYLATSCSIIGLGKLKKGLFDESLKWYLEGVEAAEKLENKELYYENRIGLGISKFARGDKEEGITILKECIENAPNQKIKHDAYFELGKTYFYNESNNKDIAESYFKKCLQFYSVEGYLKEELYAIVALGLIEDLKNNNQKALDLYLTGLNKSLKNHFFDLYIDAGNNIGNLYAKQKDYGSAKAILTTVHINAINWENLEAQKKVLNTLRLLYKNTDDYENAYALMTQLLNVNYDILNNQNKSQVNELEVKYETLKKEQEIERQRTLKQNILIGFLVVLIPLLALFYVYYQKLKTQSQLNKTLEEVNQQKVTSLLKDQEIKLIKASIEGEEKERKRIAQELHDSIGGNLATIKLQLSSQNQESIIQQIDATYNQVRDLSHNLMPKKFKETAFSSLVSEYINSVKNSGIENISLHIHPEEEINKLNETIKVELYKIIQELLTNALKHAKASQIDLHITKLEQEVKLLYEDNGVGFDTNKTKQGIGFLNIKERLKALNGSMHIDAYPNRGTVIDIDVSLT